MPLTSFPVNPQAGGKPQYHPRRIEQATLRDIGRRFVAAKLHLDHDTIAVFRRANKVAFEAALAGVDACQSRLMQPRRRSDRAT